MKYLSFLGGALIGGSIASLLINPESVINPYMIIMIIGIWLILEGFSKSKEQENE